MSRPATITATSRPSMSTTPDKYTCSWCGIERNAHATHGTKVCNDCKATEAAFGGGR